MEKLSCREAQQNLEKIKSLKQEYDFIFAQLQGDGAGFAELRRLRSELEIRVDNLVEAIDAKLGRNFGKAREIMESTGGIFLGVEEFRKTFEGINFKEENMPSIPFSKSDLERAAELNQILTLEIENFPYDTVDLEMSISNMNNFLKKRFNEEGKGRVLFQQRSNTSSRTFLDKKLPQTRWVLKSEGLIKGSEYENYWEQTMNLSRYIEEQVYAGRDLPPEVAEAVNEVTRYYLASFANKNYGDIDKLLKKYPARYVHELSQLKINQWYREDPISAVQTNVVMRDNKDKYRLEKKKIWTNVKSTNTQIAIVNCLEAERGINFMMCEPGDNERNEFGAGLTFVRDH